MTTNNPEAVRATLAALAEAQAEIASAQKIITNARSRSSAQATAARKTGASWGEIGEQCRPPIGATAARWRYAGGSAAAAQRAASSRRRSKARTALIAEARVTVV